MNQKISLYVMAVVLLFALSIMSAPAVSQAEDLKVDDWVNNEQPAGQPNAEESGEGSELNTAEEKSFALIIGQLILYTLLIVVMIYALIKFLAMRQKNLQPNQVVQLMGGTPLGNNKSLQLVKVGDNVLLVGVGDQVTLIKEFSGEDEIGGIETTVDKQPAMLPASISRLLKGKVGHGTEKTENSGFEQLFKQSLTKQKAKQQQLENDLHKADGGKEGHSS